MVKKIVVLTSAIESLQQLKFSWSPGRIGKNRHLDVEADYDQSEPKTFLQY